MTARTNKFQPGYQPEPSRILLRFVELSKDYADRDDRLLAPQIQRLCHQITGEDKSVEDFKWPEVYAGVCDISQQVLSELEVTHDELSLQRQDLTSETQAISKPPPALVQGSGGITTQAIQTLCQKCKSEWRERLSRQREWLWDDKVSPELNQIGIVQQEKGSRFETSFNPTDIQDFEYEWERIINTWVKEVSAGVYKRFAKKCNEQWVSTLEEYDLPPAEKLLVRPVFDVQAEPLEFEPVTLDIPNWFGLLFANFRKAMMFASLLIGGIGLAVFGLNNKWYLIALGTPFFAVAAALIARNERKSIVTKHKERAIQQLRSQATKQLEARLHQVQRRLKRDVETQLNKYEEALEKMRKTELKKKQFNRNSSDKIELNQIQAQRSALSEQIVELKSQISKWSLLHRQICSLHNKWQ